MKWENMLVIIALTLLAVHSALRPHVEYVILDRANSENAL